MDPRNQRAFLDELIGRAAAAPGVEAVGVGSNGGSLHAAYHRVRPTGPESEDSAAS